MGMARSMGMDMGRSKNLLFCTLLLLFLSTNIQGSNFSGKFKKSNFSLSSELTTKYVWRGIEYGDAPVFFGTLNYDWKGLNAFVLGGYAVNGKHSEVDLGVSYAHKYFTLGLSDYYFPSAAGEKDKYFNFNGKETGHSLESYLILSPFEKFPLWFTLSTYVFGADKDLQGKQAYSSYIELGYLHAFNENNELSLSVGANLNKSFYTQYESGFNVVNVTLKYLTNIPIGKFRLPVSGSLIFNPYINKPFFSLSLYLKSK